ncbi:MAG: hypothetical protein Q9216_005041, partial [Gyalolechia sp. 2 TL-2023]
MSTMTTTSHLPSTHLSIPASQNTAPVLSFNCLYTHDLRRKAKRWQDGVLRFHTFNKRIMVYDLPRNFIGDTHWREPHDIQDGDELELEKGVLIQVAEETGRTETDLTDLLEKNKAKPVPAGDERGLRNGANDQVARQGQLLEIPKRTTEQNSASSYAHLRPKSLNALLGRSGGIIGRAAVPIKSPAELRREKENNHVEEGRSPKRRRLQYTENISPSVASRGIRRTALASGSASTPTKVAKLTRIHTSRISQERQNEEEASLNPLRISSVDNPKERRTTQTKIDKRKRSLQPDGCRATDTLPAIQLSPTRKGREAENPKRREPKATSHESKGPSKPNTKIKAASKETPSIPTQPDVNLKKQALKKVSPAGEPRPEHMLRIASKKPRKKLMYRDLLPQKSPPDPDTQPPHTLRNITPADTLDVFHDAQRCRLQNRLYRRTRSADIPAEQTRTPQEADLSNHPVLPNKDPDIPMPSDSLFLTPPSPPLGPEVESIPSHPAGRNVPSPLPIDSIPSSTQAARTLTAMDALLLPQHPFDPRAQAQPPEQPKPETIKAALPPRHPSRPFQRSSVSNVTASVVSEPPPANPLTRRAATGLCKTLSNTASAVCAPDVTTSA